MSRSLTVVCLLNQQRLITKTASLAKMFDYGSSEEEEGEKDEAPKPLALQVVGRHARMTIHPALLQQCKHT